MNRYRYYVSCKIEVDADTEVRDLVINGPDANGNYTIYDTNEESTGYLYAASNSSNQLKTRALNSNANSQWSISFDENGAVVIVAQGDNTRNTIRFNTSSNPLFSCYAESNNMADVYLYVRDEEPYHEFFTDVTGYSDDNNHWQLIASPITGTTRRPSIIRLCLSQLMGLPKSPAAMVAVIVNSAIQVAAIVIL